VVGYNPYEVGKPSCSTYGMKPSSRYQGLCSAPGSSPASNSVYGANTIETYEYGYNSSPGQTANNKPPTNNINKSQFSYNNPTRPKTAPTFNPSPFNPQAAVQPSPSSPSTGGGSSFGSASRGGSHAFTTEPSQSTGRYQHKLEAYRPSAAEFEKSVHKHTILRTYIEQNQQRQDNGNQQVDQQPEPSSTKKPSRGWSLLTWRG